MVAIFTGRTLGLETGSAAVLGDRGLTGFIGNPLLGRAGEGVQVNAYTGDLVLQRQDEFLVGKGLDAAFVQTYNSLSQGSGVPTDENGDRWRQNYDRRIYGGVFATNASPTTGSQVFRVAGDGAEVAYTWNGSKFVATDGVGAYDTLEHIGSTWVWTNGDTQVKEVYYDSTVTPAALAGKLASQSDADGNTILLTYETNGNRLLSIQTAGYLTDAGGANVLDGSGNPIPLGTITLSYNSGTNDIAKIVTKYINLGVAGTPQQTQVSTWYDYDTSTSQHRLTAIKTDLTPGDLSIADGATYNINYTYDTNGRITGITQTDGSSLGISYDASGRVYQLTQAVASGVSRTTTLTYAQSDANGTYTKVTDAAGLDTKLYYATTGNNIGNLTRVTMPPAVIGAAAQTVQFFYDANGNVTQYIDAQGRSTSWTAYDANGNWLTRVSQGVSSGTTTTTRTYGANNELKTETSKASDEATVYGVSAAHTTRYVYDAEWHLRYTIGALGEVKEFQYNTAGQLATEVGYPEHTYDLTGLAATDAPNEAQMNTWRNALADRSSTEISAYTYDQRGNLLTSIDYGAASTAGAASTGNGTTQYTYVYDQEGRLISKVAGDPAAPVPQAATTYIYDGLGRAISTTGADGGVTTVSFQDKSSTTVVKLASGLVQTSVYNLAGEQIAQVDSQGNLEPDLANASQYWLSNVTRTAATAIAGNPAYLYTTTASGTSGATGGALQAVDPNEMFVFEITLKAGGGTTGNTNARLGIYGATSAWGANADSTATIVSGPGTLTQSSGSLFDIAGLSATTETRVRIVRRFAVADTARPQLYAGNSGTGAVAGDTIIASAPSVELSPGYLYDKLGRLRVAFDHSGNASYALYDGAGRKTGAVADDGSLVEYKYDAGNHVVATVKYATRVTAANLAALLDPNTTLGIADIRPADAAGDEWSWSVYDTAGRVVQTIGGDGADKRFDYDDSGNLVRQTEYFDRFNAATVAGFKAALPTAIVGISATNSDWTYVGAYNQTRSFYDQQGRLIGTMDRYGALTEIVYDESGRKVDQIQYEKLAASTFTNAQGVSVNRYATSLADIRANIISQGGNDRHTRSVYDGQLLRYTVDALGYVTQFDYDTSGAGTTSIRYQNALASTTTDFTFDAVKAQLATLASSSGDRKTYSVLNARGQVAYTIDAENGVTGFAYDQSGHVIRATRFSTPWTPAASRLVTDLDAWAAPAAVGAAADNRVTRSFYDARGQLVYTVDGEGYVTETAYDEDGRVTAITSYNTAISGLADSSTIATVAGKVAADKTALAYAQTRSSYDALGHLSDSTDAAGTITHYDYLATGEVWKETVAYGTADAVVTQYTYDAAGRVLSRSEALGSAEAATTSYSYDGLGNVISVTDPRGNTTYSYYDAMGRLSLTRDAEDYVTKTSYTNFSEVVSVTRYVTRTTSAVTVAPTVTLVSAQDAATTFAYDKLGRLIKTTDAEGKFESQTYNAFGEIDTKTNKLGGTTTNTYDRRGLLSAETMAMTSVDRTGTQQAASVTNTYAYNAFGNRLTMVEAAGLAEARTTGYGYDRNGRLVSVSGTSVPVLYGNATGAPSEGTAITKTVTSYDARGNVIETAVKVTTYNATGTLLSTDVAQSRTLAWYDKLGRKTDELTAGSLITKGTLSHWTYDARGNVSSTSVYGDEVTIAAARPATAPAAVNNANVRTTSYVYDKLDRLKSTSIADVLVGSYSGSAYQYQTKTITTTNYYDAAGNVIRQTDGRNDNTYTYYDKLNRKIAQVDRENYLTTWTLDEDGNAVEEIRYATPVKAAVVAGGAPPSINLIANSDFAQGLNKWMIGYDPSSLIASGSPYTLSNVNSTGTNCIKAEFTATTSGQVVSLATATDTPVVAGEHLSVQVGLEGLGAIASQSLNAWFFDASGALLGGSAIASVTGPQPYNTKLGGFIDAPSGAVSMRLELYAYSSGAGFSSLVVTQPMVAVVPSTQTQVVSYSTTTGGVAGLADARVTRFTYDRMGRRKTEERSGVLATSIDAASGAKTTASTTSIVAYTYNALGEVLSKREATGDTTSYTYDTMGRMTKETDASQPVSGSTAQTPVTQFWYDGLGNLTRSNENGRVTQYQYYASGKLKALTNADSVTRTYYYDGAGNKVAEKYLRTGADSTASAGSAYDAMTYTYDAAGRLTAQGYSTVTGATWGKADKSDTTQVAYSAYGEVVGRGMNLTSAQLTANAYQDKFDYDNAGHMWRTTAGDGTVNLYVYDENGNQTLDITSSGKEKLTATDTTTTDALPGSYVWANPGTGQTQLDLTAALNLLTNSGANAVGAAVVQGMIVTQSLYDGRNQLTQTRMPLRDRTSLGSYGASPYTNRKSYNAFGEVASETDARGYTTNYTYNTLGKVTKRELPAVNWTSENGTIASARPTENYFYDASGRVVGVQDANGNLNTRTLLAGTGYGKDSEALVLKEYHADGGVFERQYDLHHDLKVTINEVGKTETYVYDALGQLIEQDHQIRAAGSPGNDLTGAVTVQLKDYYDYDNLGHRTLHTNSQLGSTVKETTAYDIQGRVTSQVDLGGDTTSYTYTWDGSLVTSGLGVFGGWSKITTNSSGKTRIDKTDYYGRTIDMIDYGGHNYDYTFDLSGRLVGRMSSQGESVTWSYYNTGMMQSQVSTYGTTYYGSTITATYQYDADNHRTFEGYDATTNTINWYTGATYNNVVHHQHANVTWDAAGRMTQFKDTGDQGSAPVQLDWEYDLNGNIRHLAASYRTINDQGVVSTTATTQDNWYRYDAMNRFTTSQGMLVVVDSAGNIQKNASGQYLIGNLARGNAGATIRINYYDPSLVGPGTNGVGTAGGGQGREVLWSKSGDRLQIKKYRYDWQTNRYGSQGQPRPDLYTEIVTTENYTYTDDGYLASAAINGTTTARYMRDAMGRVTDYREYSAGYVSTNPAANVVYQRTASYNNKGLVTSDVVTSVQGVDTFVNSTTYYYNANETTAGSGQWKGVTIGGTYMGGSVTLSSTTVTKNGAAQIGNSTTNTFAWWGSAMQAVTNYVSGSTNNTSTFYYDQSGHLQSVGIQDGRPRTISFVTDVNGQILTRQESDNNATQGDPKELHYYFNGMGVGDISNNGTSDVDYATSIARHTQVSAGYGAFQNGAINGSSYADFDQSYDPINGLNYASTSSRYVVQGGDTLTSISQAVWGDASFWYLIADANGLDGTETLVAGQSLILPNKVHNSHNNTSTYRVYDPNEAIGDTAPTAVAPPKKPGCGGFGAIFLAIIAIAIVAIVAPPLIGAPASMVPATTITVGTLSTTLPAITLVGATGLTATLGVVGGAIVGGALAAAAGSIVSQGIGVATGLQDSFSWKSVGMAALGGAVGGALGKFNAFGSGAKGVGAVGNAAVRGAVSNAVIQGVGVATGLQDRFDWTGVAAASIGAGAVNVIGGAGFVQSMGGFGQGLTTNMAGSIANAATRSLIDGTDFGDNIMAALPDVIANTVGNLVAEGIAGGGREPEAASGPDDIVVNQDVIHGTGDRAGLTLVSAGGVQDGPRVTRDGSVLYYTFDEGVELFPIVRSGEESFTDTASRALRKFDLDIVVNGAFYGFLGGGGYPLLSPVTPINPDSTLTEGLVVGSGVRLAGRSAPDMAYFAKVVQADGSVGYRFGTGDPPIRSSIAAFGGAMPLIIDGLPYGEINRYSGLSRSDLAIAPVTGDPGKFRGSLVQRSNATFGGFVSKYERGGDFSTGKVIVAYNSQSGAFKIAVQPDGASSGRSLGAIRNNLIRQGYDNAVAYDGSSSATLVTSRGTVFSPAPYKNNTIGTGIGFRAPNTARMSVPLKPSGT